MVISTCTLYLLLLAVHGSIQKSSPESFTYRAAVVEFNPVFYESDPVKTFNDNAKKQVGFIKRAAEKGADVIVFPEFGLSSLAFGERSYLIPWGTLIPDPSQNYAPCTDSSIPVIEALKKVACAAEQNGIYVVVNFLEKEVCSGNVCPSDGLFLYITNVVFDREGKIVARYRKSHLFAEFGLLDVMKTPQISTFDTDFGVTFGNIIGSDIMYEEPWLTLTRKLNVTDIIFSAAWFSEMPFLTTLQMEAGWAYAEDVNILASGLSKIEWGNSGSGIYAGRQGVVSAVMPLHDHEGLLVAEVSKKSRKTVEAPMSNHNQKINYRFMSESHEYHTPNEIMGRDPRSFGWKHEKLDDFKTKVISENGLTLQKLKHSGINCRFEVNVTNLSPPITYRMIAFDGVRAFGNASVIGTRVCAIVQCSNDTIDSCGRIQTSSASFNSIEITAMYSNSTKTVMIPSTLGSDMLPLKKWNLNEYKYEEHISTSISLKTPTQNLATFGIWGRNFEKDKTEDKTISSASRIFNQILCLPLILILLENLFSFL